MPDDITPRLLAMADQMKAEVDDHVKAAISHWHDDEPCEYRKDECIGSAVFDLVVEYASTPDGAKYLASMYMEAVSRMAQAEEAKHGSTPGT